MTTKHEQTIRYIEALPVGERLSVRQIARQLQMSEGTAYRAIKEAELRGLVSTIERVGTIRIEKNTQGQIEQLTYANILDMIDGTVLGGKDGLSGHLSRFIIGAMQEDAIAKYITPDTLMIVGNRPNVQRLALDSGIAVLVTGGFEVDEEIVALADAHNLPLISTTYDSFTVATQINRSMMDQQIKEEILMVSDIYTPLEETYALDATDSVAVFHRLANQTGHSRFPVVSSGRLIGVVTAKDLIGCSEQIPIERVMTREVVSVKLHMSLASVSYRMVWQDIEMIPVVADNLDLLGTVSRQDVMKALHTVQEQTVLNQTIEDDISSSLTNLNEASLGGESTYDYKAEVSPQLTNTLGNLSYGVLTSWLTSICQGRMYQDLELNSIVEKIDLHYFSNIQIGNEIYFKTEVFHYNRRNALAQIDVYHENVIVAKAIITCQLIEGI